MNWVGRVGQFILDNQYSIETVLLICLGIFAVGVLVYLISKKRIGKSLKGIDKTLKDIRSDVRKISSSTPTVYIENRCVDCSGDDVANQSSERKAHLKGLSAEQMTALPSEDASSEKIESKDETDAEFNGEETKLTDEDILAVEEDEPLKVISDASLSGNETADFGNSLESSEKPQATEENSTVEPLDYQLPMIEKNLKEEVLTKEEQWGDEKTSDLKFGLQSIGTEWKMSSQPQLNENEETALAMSVYPEMSGGHVSTEGQKKADDEDTENRFRDSNVDRTDVSNGHKNYSSGENTVEYSSVLTGEYLEDNRDKDKIGIADIPFERKGENLIFKQEKSDSQKTLVYDSRDCNVNKLGEVYDPDELRKQIKD